MTFTTSARSQAAPVEAWRAAAIRSARLAVMVTTIVMVINARSLLLSASANQAVGKPARQRVGRDYEDRPDHERRAGMRVAQNDPLEDRVQQDSH